MSEENGRSRWVGAGLSLVVITLGLFWRSRFISLPALVAKYGGDALWALLIFILVTLFKPRWPGCWVAGTALVFCCLVEFSQLYHAPWIDQLRGFRLVSLVLGSTFNWPDLAAYTLGVAMGWLLDAWRVGAGKGS